MMPQNAPEFTSFGDAVLFFYTFFSASAPDGFDRYLKASGGRHLDALVLYRWNLELCEALLPCLHAAELTLKNAIHQAMIKRYLPAARHANCVEVELRSWRQCAVYSPLTAQNIESELSYAYLHAVVSRAGGSCKLANRHQDDRAIDAEVDLYGPFPNPGVRSEVSKRIQLKATKDELTQTGTHFSYFMKPIKAYEYLRTPGTATVPRFLVVLMLHRDSTHWLQMTADQLLMKKRLTGRRWRAPLRQTMRAASLCTFRKITY